MKEYKYNLAQRILIAIGGNAALVGGYMENYYADTQMIKKPKKKGTYGASLIAYFADQKLAKIRSVK